MKHPKIWDEREWYATATELDIEMFKAPDFLLGGLIPTKQLTLIYGKGGIGKTYTGIEIARHAANEGIKTLFVTTGEETQVSYAMKILAVGFPINMSAILNDDVELSFPENIELLEYLIERGGFGLVFFDNIARLCPLEEGGNEATRIRRGLEPLQKLASSKGVTMLGLFHENKAGASMGSTELHNISRTMLHATSGGLGLLKLNVVKSNYGFRDAEALFSTREVVLVNPLGQVLINNLGEPATDRASVFMEMKYPSGTSLPAPTQPEAIRQHIFQHLSESLERALEASRFDDSLGGLGVMKAPGVSRKELLLSWPLFQRLDDEERTKLARTFSYVLRRLVQDGELECSGEGTQVYYSDTRKPD